MRLLSALTACLSYSTIAPFRIDALKAGFIPAQFDSALKPELVTNSAVSKGYYLGDCCIVFVLQNVRRSVVVDRLLSWRSVWLSWMKSVRSWPSTGKWTRRDAAWSTPSMTKICMKPDSTWKRYGQSSLRGQLV